MATILYGECVGNRTTAPVRISDLADQGCDLETEGGGQMADGLTDGDVSLWIGAIGPLHAIATRKDASHMALRFKEPLDTRILRHFQG